MRLLRQGEASDSDSESGSESGDSSGSEEEAEAPKAASATEGLIETANLNAPSKAPTRLKPGELDDAAPVELTRRERRAAPRASSARRGERSLTRTRLHPQGGY